VIHRMAQEESRPIYPDAWADSANVAGQLGSIIAGGMVLALVPGCWLVRASR